jgi:hypothetical protein
MRTALNAIKLRSVSYRGDPPVIVDKACPELDSGIRNPCPGFCYSSWQSVVGLDSESSSE